MKRRTFFFHTRMWSSQWQETHQSCGETSAPGTRIRGRRGAYLPQAPTLHVAPHSGPTVGDAHRLELLQEGEEVTLQELGSNEAKSKSG
jgi:hypothetical protein